MSNQEPAIHAAAILVQLQKRDFVKLETELKNLAIVIKTESASLIFPQIQQIVVSIFEKDIYMRKMQSMIPNQCLETALEILISMMELDFIGDSSKMLTLLQNFFFFYLEKELGMNKEISHEEFKGCLFKLFHTFLLKQKDDSIFIKDRLIPASFLGIIMNTIEKEKSKSLKIQGINILLDFFLLLKKRDFLINFVPGVISKLKSFITGDYKLGREFISSSLNLLSEFLTVVYQGSKHDHDKPLIDILESIYNPTVFNRILAKEQMITSAISLFKIFPRICIMEVIMIGYYDLNLIGDIKEMIIFELDEISDRFLTIINEMIRNVTIHTLEDIYSHLLLIKGYIKLFHHHLFLNQNILRQFSIMLITYLEFESHIQIYERSTNYSHGYPKFIFKFLNEKNQNQVVEILSILRENLLVLDHFKEQILENNSKTHKEVLFALIHLSDDNWSDLELDLKPSFDYIIISSLFCRSIANYTSKDHQLAQILFFLLEKLGDEYLFVNQSAFTALDVITKKLGYNDINHLVIKNYDYIIDDLCNHMKYLTLYPTTPLILKSLFLYFDNIKISHSLTGIIEDLLSSVFDSIDNHQNSIFLTSFFVVLSSFVKLRDIEICKKIIVKCPYLMTFENSRISILEILKLCFEVLKDQTDVCLPVIHSIWNSLKNESKLIIKLSIIDFVEYLMETFGDFLYQRIMDEYYGKLFEYLKNTPIYRHTNEFDYVCKVFRFLSKMVEIYQSKLSLQFDTYVFCGSIGKFIDCGVVEYEKGVFNIFETLIRYDPDPVWLYLMKQTRLVLEKKGFQKIEFHSKQVNSGKNFNALLKMVSE